MYSLIWGSVVFVLISKRVYEYVAFFFNASPENSMNTIWQIPRRIACGCSRSTRKSIPRRICDIAIVCDLVPRHSLSTFLGRYDSDGTSQNSSNGVEEVLGSPWDIHFR